MKIKTDWLPHLHRYRRRELEIIFGRCPESLFASALELGCGDGYQSRLLSRWAGHLISTDWDARALPANPTGDGATGTAGAATQKASSRVEYRVCDAEQVGALFAGRRFDLIFSSNLLEHLPDPARALRGMRDVLADDGVVVHAIPSPFWKICHLLLNAPSRSVEVIEKLSPPRPAGPRGHGEDAATRDNNPKTRRRPRSFLGRFLWPDPHGVSRGNLAELRAFARSRWRRELEAAGFTVLAVLKGPVASGYGFGLDRARALLERLGFASEFIYVACKRGATCRYERHLTGSPAKAAADGS